MITTSDQGTPADVPETLSRLGLTRSVRSSLGEFGRWREADELVLDAIELAARREDLVDPEALGDLVYVAGRVRPSRSGSGKAPLRIPPERCDAVLAVQLVNRGVDRAAAVELAERVLASPGREDIDTFWHAVLVLVHAGELDSARSHCAAAESLPWAAAACGRFALALVRARLDLLRGEPCAALRQIHEVDGLHDDQFDSLGVAWTVAALVELGNLDEAHRVLDRADHAGSLDDVPDRAELLAARGALHLASGHAQAACEDFLACGRELAAWGVTNPAVLPWRSQAALAAHSRDRRSLAITLAHEELVLAGRWGTPAARGVALHSIAVVSGELDLFAEAAELLARRGELLRVQYDLGVALTARGQLGPARTALEEARRIAKAGGNAEWTRRCDEAMNRTARSGATPSLTRQELKIATLAKAGLSNKEISQRLGLANRTVEFHLSSVYRKLGVSGRTGLLDAMIPSS